MPLGVIQHLCHLRRSAATLKGGTSSQGWYTIFATFLKHVFMTETRTPLSHRNKMPSSQFLPCNLRFRPSKRQTPLPPLTHLEHTTGSSPRRQKAPSSIYPTIYTPNTPSLPTSPSSISQRNDIPHHIQGRHSHPTNPSLRPTLTSQPYVQSHTCPGPNLDSTWSCTFGPDGWFTLHHTPAQPRHIRSCSVAGAGAGGVVPNGQTTHRPRSRTLEPSIRTQYLHVH
jgi:hypothetical protein